MLNEHKALCGLVSERLLPWVGKIDTYKKDLIKNILESREYPVQTYRVCMGVIM